MKPNFVLSEVFKLGRTPWRTFDPFLFCMYHRDAYPAAHGASMAPDPALLRGRSIGSDFSYTDGWSMYHGDTVPGFPQHPHRGFETVTVVLEGHIDHSDSLGATARYGNGDTQWLTTGGGVQHSEMFPLLHSDRPNPAELFQLWLNLPAAKKMVPAYFKMLWAERTPIAKVGAAGGPQATVRVVAGVYPGAPAPESPPPDSWAADPRSDVVIWVVRMEAGAVVPLPAAASGSTANRALYMYGGNGRTLVRRAGAGASEEGAAAGATLQYYTGVKVDAGAALTLTAEGGPCDVLVVQANPIGEPVAQHGPFVMNTQQEIMQTFADYRRTQFGGWKWRTPDPVHPKEKGRFALHPNGTIDLPPS